MVSRGDPGGPARQQSDVLRPPPGIQERLDLVVRHVDRLRLRRRDEAHLDPLSPARPHPHRGQRGEGVSDLPGVPQVVVQHERDERHGRLAEAGEDPLVLVRVDIEPARGLVPQRCHQRPPPQVGEVLRLVDDDGVEAILLRQLACQFGHLRREAPLPEVAVVAIGELGHSQLSGQLLERPDERRVMSAR